MKYLDQVEPYILSNIFLELYNPIIFWHHIPLNKKKKVLQKFIGAEKCDKLGAYKSG